MTETEDTCHWCDRLVDWDRSGPGLQGIELVRLHPVNGRPLGGPVVACRECAEEDIPGEWWGLA
jgi:NMD protein affecting ribosome stability and mRNA decay